MSALSCSPAKSRGLPVPREMPSTGAALQHAKHKPNNRATPRNARSSPRIFLPPHGYSGRQSLQQVLSSQSWGISATAQGSSPQFMLHNAWLMRHHQSLELAVPLSEHQEQESSIALMVHRDHKAPPALPAYSEEFCRLQDSTKSGRLGISNPWKWKQLPASAQTPAQLHLSNKATSGSSPPH